MLRNRRCRNQKFRREYTIAPYTVDFCCVALKLVVEVDGEEHQTDEGRHYDQRRDQYLADRGYRVVRILGYEVLRNVVAVRHQIEQAIDERRKDLPPHPQPFSPATRASTTRSRRGGEGSPNELREITPNARKQSRS